MADPQIRALARRLASLEKARLHSKQPTLGFSTIEGAIQEVDADGNLTMVIGEQFDGTHTVAPVNGLLPPVPTKPTVAAALAGLRVYWDGLFEGGALVPMDFSRIEVHVSTDPAFIASRDTIVDTFETPQGGFVFLPLPYVEHHVRLVARTQSGKASEPSALASGTPSLVQNGDLAPGVGGGGAGSDGVIPGAPILSGRAGFENVFLSWDPVDSADPVSYELHGSTAAGFTPSTTTQVGLVSGTMVAINSLDKVNVLEPGVPVYFKARSVDADGASDWSGEISVTPIRGVTEEDLAASANGVNRVFHGDAQPAVDPDRAFVHGDTWFQTDVTTGQIVGLFRYDSGTDIWVAQPISHEVIASLDLGKATVGELSGEKITAGTIGTIQISADYAYVGDLTADQITGGVMRSVVNISGAFQTSEAGQRVVMDARGLHLYDSDGSPIVDLPTEAGKPAKFIGDAEIEHLTVTTLTTLAQSELAPEAKFTLQSTLQSPSNPPTVTVEYDTLQYPDDGQWASRQGWARDPSGNIYTFNTARKRVEKWSSTGTLLGESASFGSSLKWGTVTFGGGYVWALVERNSTNDYWEVQQLTDTLAGGSISWLWSGDQGIRKPAIAYDPDGPWLLIAQSSATYSDSVRVTRYTTTGGYVSAYTSPMPYNAGLADLLVGNFDFGGKRYIIGNRNSSAQWAVLSVASTGQMTYKPDEEFDFGGSSNKVGMHWDTSTGQFVSMDTSGKRRKYQGGSHAWVGPLTQSWQLAYSWYKNTTPLMETTISPKETFTMTKRARIRGLVMAIPKASVNAPTGYRVYARKTPETGIQPVAPGNEMKLQGYISAAGGTAFTLSSTLFGAGEDPSTNTFGSGAPPSEIVSATGGLVIRGDGTGAWPYLMPPGAVLEYGGATAPAGFLLCQGQTVSQAAYPALYSVIGHRFNKGVAPATGMFKLPDYRMRISIGADPLTIFSLGQDDGRTDLLARSDSHSHSHKHGTPSTVSGGSHDHDASGLSTNTRTTNYNYNTTTGGNQPRVVGIGGAGSADHNHNVIGRTGVDGAHSHAIPDTNSATGIANTESSAHSWIAMNRIIKI